MYKQHGQTQACCRQHARETPALSSRWTWRLLPRGFQRPELEPERELELEPGLSLGLDLWPAEPETLDAEHTSTLPNLGIGNVDKSTKLVADALGDLGLGIGLYKNSDGWTCTLMALASLTCILSCFLVKHIFLMNLGSTPLRNSYFHHFLMPISGLAVHSVVLGLGMSAYQ